MTDAWEPIKRLGKPNPREVRQDGRVTVEVHLTATPPEAWTRTFMATYTGFRVRSPGDDWPLPEVSGDRILSWPQEDDLTRWIRLMDDRIDEANERYQRDVLPDEQRRREQVEEGEAQMQERLERLRREAEDL